MKNRQKEFGDALPGGRHPVKNTLTMGVLEPILYTHWGDKQIHRGRMTWRHLRLLSGQCLARALQPGHPSHETVLLPPGPRQMKLTLRQKVGPLVEPHLRDGVMVLGSFPEVKNKIHTQVVSKTISSYAPN